MFAPVSAGPVERRPHSKSLKSVKTDVMFAFTDVTSVEADVRLPYTDVTSVEADVRFPYTDVTSVEADVRFLFTDVTSVEECLAPWFADRTPEGCARGPAGFGWGWCSLMHSTKTRRTNHPLRPSEGENENKSLSGTSRQQPVHALHISCRIIQRDAFEQLRLVEQQQREIFRACGVWFAFELFGQYMRRVDLQDRLAFRHAMACLLEQTLHRQAHVVIVDDDARR